MHVHRHHRQYRIPLRLPIYDPLHQIPLIRRFDDRLLFHHRILFLIQLLVIVLPLPVSIAVHLLYPILRPIAIFIVHFIAIFPIRFPDPHQSFHHPIVPIPIVGIWFRSLVHFRIQIIRVLVPILLIHLLHLPFPRLRILDHELFGIPIAGFGSAQFLHLIQSLVLSLRSIPFYLPSPPFDPSLSIFFLLPSIPSFLSFFSSYRSFPFSISIFRAIFPATFILYIIFRSVPPLLLSVIALDRHSIFG